jgi:hypothetical protein
MLACRDDWNSLSMRTRNRINKSVGLPLTSIIRQQDLRAARAEWEALGLPEPTE